MSLNKLVPARVHFNTAEKSIQPIVDCASRYDIEDFLHSLIGQKTLFVSANNIHKPIDSQYTNCTFSIRTPSRIEFHKHYIRANKYDAHIWESNGGFSIGLSNLVDIIPCYDRERLENYFAKEKALRAFKFEESAADETESLLAFDFHSTLAYISARTTSNLFSSGKHTLRSVEAFEPGYSVRKHDLHN